MSSTLNQAEASNPLYQKKMRECTICSNAGFPQQLITFQSIGQDPVTGKTIWKPIDENGNEHKHKSNIQDGGKPTFRRKNIVDIAAVTDIQEAKKLLLQGWEYKTSYPATISNIPHFILVKRE
ncbi:MAG TPA: hypothetical protein VFT71_04385 [Candidatus Nitrosocosmicus sp.]|nr:hypothetical protein [Candidatus Nitrosocosmicus sp.]